jgi:NADPH:quinone reductase-like Zn-dependent oxidoreductase
MPADTRPADTMKAVVHERYGHLTVGELPRPVPRDGEVLVRVAAASINHADLFILHGRPGLGRLAFGLRRPKHPVLGRAYAGTVTATGPGSTGLHVGDEVFGEATHGAFADYVAAPAKRLARKPTGLTFAQAATLPIAATTALQAWQTGTGRNVLVNGASGGVGTFAVQLAKDLGATVTGVCSARNAELVRGLGADHVIDYTTEDFTRGSARYDVILDLAGSHPVAAVRRALAPRGIYLASTGNGGAVLGPMPRVLSTLVTSPFVGPRLRNLIASTEPADLAHLATLVAAGRITPSIEATYPLAETAKAIDLLEKAHARGKVVLLP